MKKSKLNIVLLTLSIIGLISIKSYAQDDKDDSVKKIIFEEQRIEGKIRRPQMVLIKADQRPDFSPIVLQSMGIGSNILQMVNNDLINNSPYDKAFQFKGTSISNYQR